MDTELLKTFLEVNRTRHFGQAAENLFLTQSAVSARIRLLEQTMGVALFSRIRNNIQLTPAGEKLVRHAETMLNSWNQAWQEVSMQSQERFALAIGALPSIWDTLLQDWLCTIYQNFPHVLFNVEALGPEILVRRLTSGTLDLGFMFESPQVTDLDVGEIANIQLVLVASRSGLTSTKALASGYAMVDWGTEFSVFHAKRFRDLDVPAIRIGSGRLAYDFLLRCGGSAYLPESTVRQDIDDGRLFLVEDAPTFDQSVYAVFRGTNANRDLLDRVTSCVKEKATLVRIK